jgi:hypothetical protein
MVLSWFKLADPTLVVHVEKGERDLRTVAVVKPAHGTTIRFLSSASARPLGVVRLWFTLPLGRSGSSISMACFVYLALIIQVPTKPKGEPMIPLAAMGWIYLVFVLLLMKIHEICLKLKSGFRIIHKFPTSSKKMSKRKITHVNEMSNIYI